MLGLDVIGRFLGVHHLSSSVLSCDTPLHLKRFALPR